MQIVLALCALIVSMPLFAVAQRTFVASIGNDANPCSIALPCRGFAAAVAAVAPSGEVIALDSAGYGAFTITKSVSVIAPEGVYAGISVFPGGGSSSHGITVNDSTADVTLRGLTINGQGGDDGIRLENAHRVVIEKVAVANTGNAEKDGAGIHVINASEVIVTDSTVRMTTGVGIFVEGNSVLQIDRCRIEYNTGRGVYAKSPGGRLSATESLVAGNSHGIFVEGTSGSMYWGVSVSRSTLIDNLWAGVSISGVGIFKAGVTNNVLDRNSHGVLLSPGPGGTATMLVSDNQIVGSPIAGIYCQGPAALVAERNRVVENYQGFVNQSPCAFETMGNNAAIHNTLPDGGIITTVSLR